MKRNHDASPIKIHQSTGFHTLTQSVGTHTADSSVGPSPSANTVRGAGHLTHGVINEVWNIVMSGVTGGTFDLLFTDISLQTSQTPRQ